MRHILPYIHIWIVSLFYYIAGLLSSWFVVLFVRDIWSIVLKIYLVWWYDILLVIKLDGRREIPWRVSHRRKKPLSVSRIPEGIHFIDSGNYHYISKFWTDKIKTPFSLVVFDHHPDMQPSLFDNLMSCGCWVKKVLDTNPYLQKVCIVGAAEKLIKALHPNYGEKLKFYSETELSHEEGWNRFSHEHLNEPVYISVDKDVLDIKSAVTNWDQGSLSLTELEKLLSIILKKEEIIGVDICGECSSSLDVFQKNRELSINSKANKELLNLFLSNQNEIHPL